MCVCAFLCLHSVVANLLTRNGKEKKNGRLRKEKKRLLCSACIKNCFVIISYLISFGNSHCGRGQTGQKRSMCFTGLVDNIKQMLPILDGIPGCIPQSKLQALLGFADRYPQEIAMHLSPFGGERSVGHILSNMVFQRTNCMAANIVESVLQRYVHCVRNRWLSFHDVRRRY